MTNERVATSAPDEGPVGKLVNFALLHPVGAVFLVALSARVFVASIVGNILDGILISPDAYGWHHMAEAASTGATHNWDDFTHGLYGSTATYLVPLTILYRWFGVSILLGGIFTAVLGAGTAALAAYLVIQRLSASYAIFAGFAVALLPSQVLWSSVPLKDPMVWLVGAGLAILVVRLLNAEETRAALGWGVAILVGIVLLLYVRQHTGLLAAYSIVVASWFGTRRFRLGRVVGSLLIAAFVPWAIGLGPFGLTFIKEKDPQAMRYLRAVEADTAIVDLPGQDESSSYEKLFKEASDLRQQAETLSPEEAEALQSRAELLESQAAAERAAALEIANRFVQETEGSLSADIAHLPRGLSVMLFEPYPWHASATTTLRMAKLENILWLPLVLLAFLGLLNLRRESRVLVFPILFALGTLLVYALTEGNIGTAFRHRGELVWIVATLSAFGLRGIIDRRKRVASNRADSPEMV